MKDVWETPFIGRQTEIRHVRHALQAANGGNPQFLVLGGSAGIGKSRLVHHAMQAYEHRASTLVFSVPCIDAREAPLSFGPIISLLRQFDRLLDDETRRDLVAPVRQQLTELMPALDPADPGSSISATRAQLFERIASLLEDVSQQGLVAIVIEDVHWADRSTLDALLFLAATMTSARLAIIMTYRDDEPVADDFVVYLAQLQRNLNVTRIFLSEMHTNELIQHIYDLADEIIDPDLVARVCERAQGNPFYAEEIFKASKHGVSTLPPSVRDMFLARTSTIDDEARAVLQAMAVGGRAVYADALVAVLTARSMANGYESIRRAMNTSLIEYDDNTELVKFRHALLGELMYAGLLPGERRQLHKEWAVALSSADSVTAADLARHFVQSKQADAVTTSLEAASVAERSAGFAESAIHLDNALNFWNLADESSIPESRSEVLRRCANAHHLAGDNDKAIDRANDALTESSDLDRPLLLVDLGCYLHAAGRSVDALDLHTRAVQETKDNQHTGKVLVAQAQSLSALASHREAIDIARQALRIAEANNDIDLEATALTLIGHDLVVLGSEDEGSRALNRSLELAEKVGDASRIADAYRTLAVTLAGPLNQLDQALAVAREGIERVTELGLDRHWGVSLRSVVLDALFRLGRWDEADDIITNAFRKGPRGVAAIELHLARAKLALGSGDFALAQDDLDAIAMLTHRSVDVRYSVPWATLCAGLALWQHRYDDAVANVEHGLSAVLDSDDVWFVGPLLWHGIRAHVGRALIAQTSNNENIVATSMAIATELFDDLQQRAKTTDAHGALSLVLNAYVLLCQGELSRMTSPANGDAWREVVQIWHTLGHPYPMAYAQYRLAESLSLARRRTNETTSVLRDSYATATRMDALPLRHEIEALAQRAGIDLCARDEDAPEIVDVRSSIPLAPGTPSLTKRELQVLDLVALGKGNRAIADSLFISEKTASVHVSNIMAKLGARSRGEVAAIVHQSRN